MNIFRFLIFITLALCFVHTIRATPSTKDKYFRQLAQLPWDSSSPKKVSILVMRLVRIDPVRSEHYLWMGLVRFDSADTSAKPKAIHLGHRIIKYLKKSDVSERIITQVVWKLKRLIHPPKPYIPSTPTPTPYFPPDSNTANIKAEQGAAANP
jgi:hypothetical protein